MTLAVGMIEALEEEQTRLILYDEIRPGHRDAENNRLGLNRWIS